MALPTRIAESTGTAWYVDASIGLDSRTAAQAQSEATPWLTIQKAITTIDAPSTVAGGPRILVKPGTYVENFEYAPSSARKSDATHVVTIEGVSGFPRLRYKSGGQLFNIYHDNVSFFGQYLRLRNLDLGHYEANTNGAAINITGPGGVNNCEFDQLYIHDCRPLAAANRAQGVFADDLANNLQFWRCHVKNIDINAQGATQLSHAFYLEGDSLYLVNCLVHDCRNGMGMQIFGGGVGHGTVGIYHSTFYNNLRAGILIARSYSNVEIRNCIMAGNGTYGIQGYNDGLTAGTNQTANFCSMFGNGTADTIAEAGSPITFANNLATDPLFEDTANKTFRLQAGSPCRNAGDATFLPTVDLDGIGRIANDMGAYQHGRRWLLK